MDKKKILIIDNSLYPTGALRSILNTIASLENDFTFLFAIATESRVGPELEARGYKVFRVPFLEISKRPGALVQYLPSLYRNAKQVLRIVREEGVDLIHVNDLFNQLGTAVKILRPSVPVIYHVRLLASSYIGKLYGLFSFLIKKYADRLICVSGPVLQDIGQNAKSVIIYDGMETGEQLPPWNGLQDPQRAKILYLGNVVRGKGQQWGVLALAEAVKTCPGLRMAFAGGVHSEADVLFLDELNSLAVQHGVAYHISFTGAVTDVEGAIKAADIVLNMSESESFSMVCLEAMLYGVPLVASDCGGPRDITDDGRMAALVPNRDYKAAAAAITSIINSPERSKIKAAEARKYAAEKYALSRSVAQLKELYLESFKLHRF